MKIKALALSLLMLPALAMAGGAGYGSTKWDMTPSEVISATSGAHITAPANYANNMKGKVSIDSVEIGAAKYTVNFLFKDDKLTQTNVQSVEKKNPLIAINNFKTLAQLLTQKYGKAEFNGENMTWKTADTTIELSKIIIDKVIAQVTIRYVPNTRVTDETKDL